MSEGLLDSLKNNGEPVFQLGHNESGLIVRLSVEGMDYTYNTNGMIITDLNYRSK